MSAGPSELDPTIRDVERELSSMDIDQDADGYLRAELLSLRAATER